VDSTPILKINIEYFAVNKTNGNQTRINKLIKFKYKILILTILITKFFKSKRIENKRLTKTFRTRNKKTMPKVFK